MITLVTGRCGSGKSRWTAEQIRHDLEEDGREIVLIVPEQQTVVWETKMAEQLPPSANLRLEITNFTRLANSVFRQTGGLADPVVDEGSRLLLTWRAMTSVWESLGVYRNAAGREDRSLPHLLAAIDELKAGGITPEAAEQALNALPEDDPASAALRARLSDVVTTYAAYNLLLHERGIDRGDLLDSLAKTLARYPYFAGKTVYVDSFFSLTRYEERILFEIFRQADGVAVTFACPPGESEEVQFGEVHGFLKKAAVLAERAGKPVTRVSLTENVRHRNVPVLAKVERYLFDYAADLPETDGTDTPSPVRVWKCADLADESEACAAIVDGLLREGFRCGEIAVVARDMKTREGVLDAALRRHGVRCFLSETDTVTSSPAVAFFLRALQVAIGGWQRDDVVRFVKTGLTPVGRPSADENEPDASLDADLFEQYTGTWNIRGRRRYSLDPENPIWWSMNPAGYTPLISDAGREILLRVNRARAAFVPALERFLSVFDKPCTVREIAGRMVAFAEDCDLAAGLRDAADSYRAIGMPREAMRVLSSWDAVCGVLERMVEILGDVTLDAGRFSGLFSRAAAALDQGTIPTGVDEVVLGSASGVRFEEARAVILLGSGDGEFPASAADSASFFDDRDRVLLESVGVTLPSLGRKERAARETFMYYRTAAAATERLYVLAPHTGANPDTTSAGLSDGAARIAEILRSCGNTHPVEAFSALPLAEIVHHRETAEYLLARRPDEADQRRLSRLLGDAMTDNGSADSPLTTGEDRVAGIRPDRIALSQTKLDTFVKCPFRYACKYRLKIAPAPTADFDASDIGTFLHSVLEHVFGELPKEKLYPEVTVTLEELEDVADDVMETYRGDLAKAAGSADGRLADGQRADGQPVDGRLDYLFRRLRRHVMVFLEAILREWKQSAFAPAAFELPIGMPDSVPESVEPIVFRTPEGTEVVLRGVADRVDLCERDGQTYLRIVDYKTGKKEFSLENVRQGVDVQLLIYLYSLWRFGVPTASASEKPEVRKALPAGAVYLIARPAAVSVNTMPDEKDARDLAIGAVKRSGIFLDDEDVLRAMDRELNGTYLPVNCGKNGIKAGAGAALCDLEGFGALYREMEEVIGKIAGEIANGNADAKPRRSGGVDPCPDCPNRYLCRREDVSMKGGAWR